MSKLLHLTPEDIVELVAPTDGNSEFEVEFSDPDYDLGFYLSVKFTVTQEVEHNHYDDPYGDEYLYDYNYEFFVIKEFEMWDSEGVPINENGNLYKNYYTKVWDLLSDAF